MIQKENEQKIEPIFSEEMKELRKVVKDLTLVMKNSKDILTILNAASNQDVQFKSALLQYNQQTDSIASSLTLLLETLSNHKMELDRYSKSISNQVIDSHTDILILVEERKRIVKDIANTFFKEITDSHTDIKELVEERKDAIKNLSNSFLGETKYFLEKQKEIYEQSITSLDIKSLGSAIEHLKKLELLHKDMQEMLGINDKYFRATMQEVKVNAENFYQQTNHLAKVLSNLTQKMSDSILFRKIKWSDFLHFPIFTAGIGAFVLLMISLTISTYSLVRVQKTLNEMNTTMDIIQTNQAKMLNNQDQNNNNTRPNSSERSPKKPNSTIQPVKDVPNEPKKK